MYATLEQNIADHGLTFSKRCTPSSQIMPKIVATFVNIPKKLLMLAVYIKTILCILIDFAVVWVVLHLFGNHCLRQFDFFWLLTMTKKTRVARPGSPVSSNYLG